MVMSMTPEEFKRDALKHKEKYLGQIIITKEKRGYLVGTITEIRRNGLKIKPIARFKSFRAARKFVLLLLRFCEPPEPRNEPPSYIA